MFADTTNKAVGSGQDGWGARRGARIQNFGGTRLPEEDNRFVELLIFSC